MYGGNLAVPVVAGFPREILQGGARLLWAPGDRLRLLSNLRICPIKPMVSFHKSLSEFYIFIFLNKLKNNWKSQKHEQINLKLGGLSEFHKPLLFSSGPGPLYRMNPPLIGPVWWPYCHVQCDKHDEHRHYSSITFQETSYGVIQLEIDINNNLNIYFSSHDVFLE